MTYLIDTNIISEVRKGEKCNRNVAAWYASIDDADIYLSVLVLGEIRKGIERARPDDPAQARAIEQWLLAVQRSFADRVLPVDHAVADEWGRMSARRPGPSIDALLAATAKVHRMTLVTRNTADVTGLGAEVLNPFEPAVAGRPSSTRRPKVVERGMSSQAHTSIAPTGAPAMLALRLPPEIEKRLDALARKTGRSKSFYAREAILRHLEDLEDQFLARRRLARGGGRVTLEELERELDAETPR